MATRQAVIVILPQTVYNRISFFLYPRLQEKYQVLVNHQPFINDAE
jgi:hypothetical protein